MPTRLKPFPLIPPTMIKRGKQGRKQWCGRIWLNTIASNARAAMRWKVTQKPGKGESYENRTRIWISDCNEDIELYFQHHTLREYRYSQKKLDKMITELYKIKRAIYSAAVAHGLKVDQK